MTRVRVGDLAPDFTAPGTGDRSYSLSDFKGQPLVLVFYPGDATPTCTTQLNEYSTNFAAFGDLEASLLALSPQDVDSHEAFHADHNFAFPLLYDEDKRIGASYGVVGPLGFYRRSLFVVDAHGTLAYVSRSTAGLGYPSTDLIIEALRSAQAAA